MSNYKLIILLFTSQVNCYLHIIDILLISVILYMPVNYNDITEVIRNYYSYIVILGFYFNVYYL